MFWGYNTNGLAHHDFKSGLDLVAREGYRGVAITIDHGWLCPPPLNFEAPAQETFRRQVQYLKDLQRSRGLHYVLETGARFLLNPFVKHEPTLVSPLPDERRDRVNFYRFAIDCAAELHADAISIWSGVLHDGASDAQVLDRLVVGLNETLEYAAQKNVSIAFEPEPGMFIDNMASFQRLLSAMDEDPRLKLTIDIGHLQCMGEPIPETLCAWQNRLINVHLDDMVPGVHEHLPLGRGTIDFSSALNALKAQEYEFGVYVELSRDSHRAPDAVRETMDFLRNLDGGTV